MILTDKDNFNFIKNKKSEKRKENENTFTVFNMKFNKDKVYAFSAFVLAISFIFLNDKSKRVKFVELTSNKKFLYSMLIALAFSFYTLFFLSDNKDNERVRTATKHAIIGFLIGMMHHFDFKVGPFWFVWLTSFYLDMGE